MSLSIIPDLCLLTILDRIPIRDLLSTVNLVCHRWSRLRPVVCNRRPLLILYDNKNYLDNLNREIVCHSDIAREVVDDDGYGIHFDKFPSMQHQLEYNALFVSQLNDQTCEHLVTLFPRLTKLHLFQSVHWWPTVISHVNHLLEKWSHKLVHCSLWLYTEYESKHVPDNGYLSTLIDSLFDRFNKLSSLKRLTLKFAVPFHAQHGLVSHELKESLCPALLRLEHFEYRIEGNHLDYLHYLDKYIHRELELALKQSNCALKTVRLHSMRIDRILQLSPRLVSKFTDSDLSGLWNYLLSESDVLLGLSRLSSLDTLTLSGQSLTELGSSFPRLISRLTHLTQLTLLRFMFTEAYLKSLSTVQPSFHPQMSSIKALQFYFSFTFSHSYVEQLFIAQLFPNVQVIRFVQNISGVTKNPAYPACCECDYAIHAVEDEQGEDGPILSQIRQCSRMSVKTLANCSTTLRKIFFSRNFYPLSLDWTNHDVCCVFSSDLDELAVYRRYSNY